MATEWNYCFYKWMRMLTYYPQLKESPKAKNYAENFAKYYEIYLT